jgi:hypothetical protein
MYIVSTQISRRHGNVSTGGQDTGSLLIGSEVGLVTMRLMGAAVAARSTLRWLRLDRRTAAKRRMGNRFGYRRRAPFPCGPLLLCFKP